MLVNLCDNGYTERKNKWNARYVDIFLNSCENLKFAKSYKFICVEKLDLVGLNRELVLYLSNL